MDDGDEKSCSACRRPIFRDQLRICALTTPLIALPTFRESWNTFSRAHFKLGFRRISSISQSKTTKFDEPTHKNAQKRGRGREPSAQREAQICVLKLFGCAICIPTRALHPENPGPSYPGSSSSGLEVAQSAQFRRRADVARAKMFRKSFENRTPQNIHSTRHKSEVGTGLRAYSQNYGPLKKPSRGFTGLINWLVFLAFGV